MTVVALKHGTLKRDELPPRVTTYLDRFGKQRWRYREPGGKTTHFSAPPGTEIFQQEYETFTAGHAPPSVQRRRDKPTFVYFVLCGDAIKIGMTNNIAERMSKIQTDQPYEVRKLVAVPGGQDLEREYHNRFLRHHLRGEWFSADREIVSHAMWLALQPDAIL